MPWLAAAAALLFVVPFLALNHIVVFRLDPVFSWLRPGAHTSAQEVVVLWAALGLLLVGAVVALLPLRRVRGWAVVPNLVVAALLLIAFVLIAVGLGHDLACAPNDYLCD